MSIKKNIGKNTLGDGKKMQVDLRTYNRSTHDLSFAWRNTQGVGTLVPCCKLLALPGDTADIDIDAKIMTHPTVGPLFGSYKLQVDFFVAPIRLYNAMLHNNALNIGLDMSKVKLPKLKIEVASSMNPTSDNPWSQISPSSILAYLGLRGYGMHTGAGTTTYSYNAVPILAYLDIFKNYYANKQEEKYYWLGKSTFTYSTNPTNVTFEAANGIWYVKSGSQLVVNGATEENIKTLVYKWTSNDYTVGEDGRRQGLKTIELTHDEMLIYFDFTWGNGNGTYTIKSSKLFAARAFLKADFSNEIAIQEAELTELDTIREKILSNGTNEVSITTLNSTYISNLATINGRHPNTMQSNQGLLLKSYQSDLFNNWINTEWVDGENGISAITAVSTAGDEFTIDSLNLAKKVYDMLNRIAVSGGSYRDWIETVYTSDFTIHAETPIYEGGMSDEIVFEQVVSNSATSDEPLGTLAGRGTLGGNRKGGKLHIKVNEPSYIIGICSITPRVDYCQGNDWDMYLETMNDLHKPQLDGIGYEDLLCRDAAWWQAEGNSFGKTVAWIHYMTNFNKTYGNFAIEGNEAFMVLNRYFDPEDGDYTGIINTSSYINPRDYTYTFAENKLDSQNFWVQLGFGIKMRRVMSAKQIPTL